MDSKPLFKELWKFNTLTSKWSKIPMCGDVPLQLASHTATLVDIRGQVLLGILAFSFFFSFCCQSFPNQMPHD
jgi:hypothetical protein